MDLDFAKPLAQAKVIDEQPVHERYGVKEARLVAPGDPSRSILLRRLSIRGRGQMPQLATDIADERAVKLFTRWIKGLKPTAVK